MGIKNFFKIKIDNPKSKFNGEIMESLGEIVQLKKFKNQRICNDASIIIYQSILSQEKNNLTDKSGRTTVHLNTIFNKVIQQNEAGIEQIWIFDSPIQDEKKFREIEKRKNQREKYAHHDYVLNKEHVEDIQKLFRLMGIMYIIAPPKIQAEQYGSKLCSNLDGNPFCKYMLSSDSDVLFFGGNLLKITTAKTTTGKSKKTVYKTFDLDFILNETGLSYENFIKMGVAMGTDFNEGNTQRIGPATVMKKLDNIELTPEMIETIKYFQTDIDMGKAEIVYEKYDKQGLLDFLTSRDFNPERLETRLSKFQN